MRSLKGFSLVELLVVVSIIGILSTIGISIFKGAATKTDDAKKKADVEAAAKALEENYTLGGGYVGITGTDFIGGIIPANVGVTIPPSPNNKSFNVCTSLSDGSSYCRSSLQGSATIATPTPAPTATPTPALFRYVFVTSLTYNGNLGGLSGADSKCQSLADTAGIGNTARKTYEAWLSDRFVSAASRLNHANVYYKLRDGTTIIANDWANLIRSGSALQHQIDMTESGEGL